MDKSRLLFLTILIEGYVVLACEIFAIRLLIPFVGSGVEVTAIVIGFVLMPLAMGYHIGGAYFRRAFRAARKRGSLPTSVRRKLVRNLVTGQIFLAFALSSSFLDSFFALLEKGGVTPLFQTAFYSILFLIVPVFLLGQTVPLVSHFFSRRRLSEITGRMLFFSTIGSFLGSLFTSLVLMSFLGVRLSVFLTLLLLSALGFLLARKEQRLLLITGAAVLIYLFMNDLQHAAVNKIVGENAYNTTSIFNLPENESVLMSLNRSFSALYSKDPERLFPYIQYVENNFVSPLIQRAEKEGPKDVLVIGAGGFTVGLQDTVNHYVFVDIDSDLKDIAEKHFLPAPLGPNKKFVAASARAFIHRDQTLYDLIFLDVYTTRFSVPMECVTREFLLEVKKSLKPDGVVLANIIADPFFRDRFSTRYNATFASVFPHFSRHIITPQDPWQAYRSDRPSNLLYIYAASPIIEDQTVYTDDRNTHSLDQR